MWMAARLDGCTCVYGCEFGIWLCQKDDFKYMQISDFCFFWRYGFALYFYNDSCVGLRYRRIFSPRV